MKLFDLTGRTAIVTGSSKGIGRAIAEQMALAGANVVISSRKIEPCEAVAAEIARAGGKAIAIACHIGDDAQLGTLVAKTREAFGRIDILVCNAAINPHYGAIEDISDEIFDRMMTVNIRSNLRLANLVRPDMAARQSGAIVIISSVAGLMGNGTIGAYGITKAADMQLARNLAVAWGKDGIRVNAIAPGLIKTDFAKALWDNPDTLQHTLRNSPLRKIGEPVDIAGAALLLASDAGRFITGTTIVIDGGVTVSGRG
jgi:NAD(P)-dependent dehydrogenase (short-subunit alcohol dehydrogenase family)